MKTLRFLSIIAITILSSPKIYAQTRLTFTEVVFVDSVKKDELFNRARMWVNDRFVSGKDVIQIQDKQSGEITGRGFMLIPSEIKATANYRYNATVYFNFKIFVKDGRYKYLFENFENTDLDPTSTAEVPEIPFGYITDQKESPIKWTMWPRKKMDEAWANLKADLDHKVQLLITSLKESMNSDNNLKDF